MKDICFQFLDEIVPSFSQIPQLFAMREVNQKFKNISEKQLLKRFESEIGNFESLISLLITLDAPSKNSNLPNQNKKLYWFIFFSRIMQDKTKEQIKKYPRDINYFWKLAACISVLNLNNFNSLSQEMDLNILSLWKGQQEIKLNRILFTKLVKNPEIKLTYKSVDFKQVILACIARHANHLVKFFLKIGAGTRYGDNQSNREEYELHPIVACIQQNNLLAFEYFLIYAEHLLEIKAEYSGVFHAFPPLYVAAFKLKRAFIDKVAEKKPDKLEVLDTNGGNIVHALFTPGPNSDLMKNTIRSLFYSLKGVRRSLSSVKNHQGITPDSLWQTFNSQSP